MRRRSRGLDEEPGDGAGPWEEDLARWMAPVLAALGHMGRLRWAPVYLQGLLGPDDRKSVQPMAASGFDVITSLRYDIEIAVESNTPPQALLDGPWSAYAGDPLAMSGAGSSDADGDALSYAWAFGDGQTGAGAAGPNNGEE